MIRNIFQYRYRGSNSRQHRDKNAQPTHPKPHSKTMYAKRCKTNQKDNP
jgi:hypothetical protein